MRPRSDRQAGELLSGIAAIRQRRLFGAAVAARLYRAEGVLLGFRLAPGQRIGVAIVQPPDPVPIEPLLSDLEIGAGQCLGRKLFDGKSDRLGGACKPPVAKCRALVLAVIGREQLGLSGVIEAARLPYGVGSWSRARRRR